MIVSRIGKPKNESAIKRV